MMKKFQKLLLNAAVFFIPCLGFAQTAADTVCVGDTSTIRYYISNPENGVQYTWNLSSGGSIISQTNDTLFVKWGTVSGLYKITVNGTNQAGCNSQEVEYWIMLQGVPELTLKPEFATICDGGSITVRASGAENYLWQPSEGLSATSGDVVVASPDTNTIYTVSANLNGCVASKTFTIETAKSPVADFSFEQTGNYTLQFTNTSTDAISYQWDFGPGNTSTDENPLGSFPYDGTYRVTLIAENSCGKDTLTRDIDVIKLGFSDITGTSIEIAPNPLTDFTRIHLSMRKPEKINMRLFNATGQLISNETYSGNQELNILLNMAGYANGIYLLQLRQGNEFVNYKLIKQ